MCSQLEYSKAFKSMVNKMDLTNEELKCMNNRFLNYHQLSNKCTLYYSEIRKSRLDNFTLIRKLNKLGCSLDMHQRFLISISDNNIPRLNQFVRVALRNKRKYLISCG